MRCGRLSDMATPRVPDRQDSPGRDCVRRPRPANCACWFYRPDHDHCSWWCPVMAADRVIRWTTASAAAGVAAMASYEHAYALVRVHGEAGRTGRPVPLTMDGLTYATSIVMLDSARRKVPVPALARWLLGLGIAATLAANVAHGLGDGLAGPTVVGAENLRHLGRCYADRGRLGPGFGCWAGRSWSVRSCDDL
jgi:hypothetical protein